MFYSIVIVLQDLSTGWLQCDPGPLFKQETHALPGWISNWVRLVIVHYWKKLQGATFITSKKSKAFTLCSCLGKKFLFYQFSGMLYVLDYLRL